MKWILAVGLVDTLSPSLQEAVTSSYAFKAGGEFQGMCAEDAAVDQLKNEFDVLDDTIQLLEFEIPEPNTPKKRTYPILRLRK